MNLYVDASALVKRFVSEPGSDAISTALDEAEARFICRIGFTEVSRALHLHGSAASLKAFAEAWEQFDVIEVDRFLTETAADLTVTHKLRSLDALHLASALLVGSDTTSREAWNREITMATWDRRLHAAAKAAGLALLPESL